MAPVGFSCVKFHDTSIYPFSCVGRMRGNMPLFVTGCPLSHNSDPAGFNILFHNREYLHQICRGFSQRNRHFELFKLYMRQIEKLLP